MRYYPRSFRRLFYKGSLLVIATLVAIFGLLQIRPVDQVQAAQITTRSILMSTSNPAATANSVTYQVRFTAASSYTVKAIVIDFCANDPIIGDATCTAPTGFDVGSATPTIITCSSACGTNDATLSPTVLGSGWTAAGTNLITGSQYRTITLTNSTGVAVTSSSVIAFDMTNVTNPTTTGTFYARVLTYTTTTTGYAPGSEGSYSDYGGIALSTAALITITSKVQEQLTFCVYTSSCGTAANILLGDTNDILSTSAVAVNKAVNYSLSTNAAHGATVYLKGNTLTSGGNTIPAAGTGVSNAGFIYNTSGTDFFGLCSYNTSVAFGSAPTVTNYYAGTGNSGTCSGTTQDTGGTLNLTSLGGPPYATFGFNATNTATTYGDQLSSIAAPGTSVNIVVLAAGVNATQADGIYLTTLQLIAIGTY
jgi:hypothetical protein